jgi:magnesium transporter
MAVSLSRLLNRPVWNMQGQSIGRCKDLLVRQGDESTPLLRALVITRPDGGTAMADDMIAGSAISTLAPAIILNTNDPEPYKPLGNELSLRDQVLDRQIVDVEGRRVVRVNDLELTRMGKEGRFYLTGVAVGPSSFLRRLGVEQATGQIAGLLGRQIREHVIPWGDVASVQPDAPIRLRVTRERIGQINPVDIAEIVSDLDHQEGVALLSMLDNETAADTISEVAPELQPSLLAALPPERAADVLEEMDPDDAADLLGALDETAREDYLELMEDQESLDVVKLLAYPENTAGGIMTTEYATCPTGLRAGEALDHLRSSERAREDETLYYIHIVDAHGRLHGVISLRDLVLADPDAPLDAIMASDPITVEPLMPQTEVARVVAKYNLLEVPVVDEDKIMHGIVTVDDAIDAVIPTAWKKRLPRIY